MLREPVLKCGQDALGDGGWGWERSLKSSAVRLMTKELV